MAHRQFLAQLGVFALVGLNVAAYVAFWPRRDGVTDAGPKDDLVPSIRVEKKRAARPANPVAPPADFVRSLEPVRVPAKVPMPKEPAPPTQDPLRQLLEQIAKDGPTSIELPPRIPDSAVQRADTDPSNDPGVPRILPAMQAEPLPSPAPKPLLPSPPALPAALRPTIWQIKTEPAGPRIQVVASVPQRPLSQFTFLCDRLEDETPDHLLRAHGNVEFQGAGYKGKCRQITLALGELRLHFEGAVEIGPPALGAENRLRGDKITWEMPDVSTTLEPRPVLFREPRVK